MFRRNRNSGTGSVSGAATAARRRNERLLESDRFRLYVLLPLLSPSFLVAILVSYTRATIGLLGLTFESQCRRPSNFSNERIFRWEWTGSQ